MDNTARNAPCLVGMRAYSDPPQAKKFSVSNPSAPGGMTNIP